MLRPETNYPLVNRAPPSFKCWISQFVWQQQPRVGDEKPYIFLSTVGKTMESPHKSWREALHRCWQLKSESTSPFLFAYAAPSRMSSGCSAATLLVISEKVRIIKRLLGGQSFNFQRLKTSFSRLFSIIISHVIRSLTSSKNQAILRHQVVR